jgi:RecA/RadA recombinase
MMRLASLGFDVKPLGLEGIVTSQNEETTITVDGVPIRSVTALIPHAEPTSSDVGDESSVSRQFLTALAIALLVRCVLR